MDSLNESHPEQIMVILLSQLEEFLVRAKISNTRKVTSFFKNRSVC